MTAPPSFEATLPSTFMFSRVSLPVSPLTQTPPPTRALPPVSVPPLSVSSESPLTMMAPPASPPETLLRLIVWPLRLMVMALPPVTTRALSFLSAVTSWSSVMVSPLEVSLILRCRPAQVFCSSAVSVVSASTVKVWPAL